MSILQQKFKVALSDIYDDPNEYISDKKLLEQPAVEYFYEKHKDGPDQEYKHSKMRDALYGLSCKHGSLFFEFIDVVNLDPEFPLLVECDGCLCEVCDHMNFHEIDLEWKAGVIPTNTLE